MKKVVKFISSNNTNYRATDITGSAMNLHFLLDELGNIESEGDAAGVPTPNESYQYDPLYRLKEVDGATGALWQRKEKGSGSFSTLLFIAGGLDV